MYAVVFDIDTNCISGNSNTPSYPNAYGDIRKFMEANHFVWQQRSLYFGDATVNAVTCVMTIQALSRTYSWLSICVRDIRMLRIEENNDLLPAVRV